MASEPLLRGALEAALFSPTPWLTAAASLVLLHLLLILCVEVNWRKTPDLGIVAPLSEARPSVCVVVPARNEEANIGACLDGILAQDYAPLSVRVVDDCSTDGTAAEVQKRAKADPRLQLVRGTEPPEGWIGKTHAIHQGTLDVEPDFFLFVDADLVMAPGCLANAVATAEARGADLLTTVPRLDAIGAWELAVQPLIAQLIAALLDVQKLHDPTEKLASANGPFMLFRTSAYRAIGGHEAVRAEVVEDLRLAERIKAQGYRLLYTRAVHQASLRMYGGLSSLVEGWSKNFHEALGPHQWTAPLAALALITVFGGPLLLSFACVALLAAGVLVATPLTITAAAAPAAVVWSGRWHLHHRYRVPAGRAYLQPLGAVVIAWILIRSVRARRRGESITWRGRAIGGR
jgi:hypothetical protein